jgi:diguanylate cyclase
MIIPPSRDYNRVAIADPELAQLEKQIEKARVLLTRLQTDLIEVGNNLGGEARLLIDANQQLVLAALNAQTQAETTAYSAGLDALTSLPNRTVLLDRFEQAIVAAQRRGTCLALLFLDIDNFKHINDTLGHAVGDKALLCVANCLTAVVRKADTVSRHGGDEFLILLAEIAKMSDATIIADKIRAALGAPHQLDDRTLTFTASIGISIYPDHGANANLLIERADLAMYRAKRHGLGSCVYVSDEITGDVNLKAVDLSASALLPNPTVDPRCHDAYLREANEQLIVAALNAQDLQMGAELAQQKQSTFLAVLAHELRNPLAPLRTAGILLGFIGTDALKLKELQNLIDRQVTRMTRLLDDLFDIARINSGKLTLICEALDINALIHEVADIYAPLFKKNHQEFIVEIPIGEAFVEGDPCRLTQIFSNLLDNAAKYTPEGGQVKLIATIIRDTLVMTFSDNGIGIVATTLPHIFEPFVQDSNARAINGDGLGIGLTVVRELVEAHKGSIAVRSEGSGLGSEFIVTLPLLDVIPRPLNTSALP